MIKTTQYNYASERLEQISHYRPLPGSAMSQERQELLELRAQYESEHDTVCVAEYDRMVEFEERFLASMER